MGYLHRGLGRTELRLHSMPNAQQWLSAFPPLRHIARKSLSVAILMWLTAAATGGQAHQAETPPRPNLLSERWPAHWIASPDGPRREFGVFYFRKAFELAAVPNHFIIHASADNRYELFVNGARVVEGPARGDLDHWRYETLDIAARLRLGKNLLAAIVWNFAMFAPMAQMTNETGLIVQGDTAAESAVNTNKTWRCLKDTAWEIGRA